MKLRVVLRTFNNIRVYAVFYTVLLPKAVPKCTINSFVDWKIAATVYGTRSAEKHRERILLFYILPDACAAWRHKSNHSIAIA